MKKILIFSAMTMFAMISCKQNDEAVFSGKIEVTPVLNGSYLPTKAPIYDVDGKGAFTDGDQIGLFITDRYDQLIGSANRLMTAPSAKFYWENLGSKSLVFSGYYPYDAVNTATEGTFTIAASEPSVAADTIKNDLLLGRSEVCENKASEATIKFDHALNMIQVNLSSGKDASNADYYTAAQLASATVTVQTKSRAKVNYITATASEDAECTTALNAPVFAKEGKFFFFTAPMTTIPNAPFVRVVVDNAGSENSTVSYGYALSDDMIGTGKPLADGFKNGQKLILNLKLTKTGITLGSFTINAWDEVSNVEVTPGAELQ